jgi:hypothetical protein
MVGRFNHIFFSEKEWEDSADADGPNTPTTVVISLIATVVSLGTYWVPIAPGYRSPTYYALFVAWTRLYLSVILISDFVMRTKRHRSLAHSEPLFMGYLQLVNILVSSDHRRAKAGRTSLSTQVDT